MGLPARLIRASDTRRTRWRNNGGWTTEIASDPPVGQAHGVPTDFRWRVSIAEIERDGPFSTFPGVDRDLLLLSGNGMDLDLDEDPPAHRSRFQHLLSPASKPRCAGCSTAPCATST